MIFIPEMIAGMIAEADKKTRERRIDEAVRGYICVPSNREHLLGTIAAPDGQPCPDCVRLIHAEYWRIVERVEGLVQSFRQTGEIG